MKRGYDLMSCEGTPRKVDTPGIPCAPMGHGHRGYTYPPTRPGAMAVVRPYQLQNSGQARHNDHFEKSDINPTKVRETREVVISGKRGWRPITQAEIEMLAPPKCTCRPKQMEGIWARGSGSTPDLLQAMPEENPPPSPSPRALRARSMCLEVEEI